MSLCVSDSPTLSTQQQIGAHAQHIRRVVVVRIPIVVDIREVGGVGDGIQQLPFTFMFDFVLLFLTS